MNKFFVLFITVMVSALALIGCGSDKKAEVITDLQATVDDLQNQVQEYSALKSELDFANNSIAELQSQIDTIQSEKDEMISKLEMLYKIEPVEETMYTVSDAVVYDDLYGEVFGNEPSGTISAEQEIKITGKSALDWYEIELDGKKQYISGSLISTTKPVQQSSNGKSDSTKNTSGGGGGQPSGGGGQPSGGGGSTPADQQALLDSIFGNSNTGLSQGTEGQAGTEDWGINWN